MKTIAWVLLAGIGLTACSEPEVSNVEYNKGRQRAEMEGCHCNPDLERGTETEADRQGRGWADGYVDNCIRFREERRC